MDLECSLCNQKIHSGRNCSDCRKLFCHECAETFKQCEQCFLYFCANCSCYSHYVPEEGRCCFVYCKRLIAEVNPQLVDTCVLHKHSTCFEHTYKCDFCNNLSCDDRGKKWCQRCFGNFCYGSECILFKNCKMCGKYVCDNCLYDAECCEYCWKKKSKEEEKQPKRKTRSTNKSKTVRKKAKKL